MSAICLRIVTLSTDSPSIADKSIGIGTLRAAAVGLIGPETFYTKPPSLFSNALIPMVAPNKMQ
jgi:hypothetical protein